MSTSTLTRTRPATTGVPMRDAGSPTHRARGRAASPFGTGRTGQVGRPVTGVSTRPRRGAQVERTRPADRRPAGRVAAPVVAGTRCAAPAVDRRIYVRRRTTALAVVLGGALAVLVWAVAIIGSNYAASVAPTPAGTEIVHVRQGDSLSSIADRVAPDVPRAAVIQQIVERNDLPSSGLRVGQALIAPAYR
ncbi:hypothetical protein D7316_00744 [Gordonia insulae]|uniref:LysM domain-containing protein n=2 Tax=Gordonia insulae TaxID=2420509 RepID=A0A3G8JGP9_9ACTN|nr:hypothetical protein D7316_00744 [Gordonia insulae]